MKKAVPFVPEIVAGSKQQAAQAATQLNKLIQEQKDQGWEFSHVDSLTTYVNAGCLGALVGRKSEVLFVQLAIFEHPA